MKSVQIHLNSEDAIRYYSSTSYCEFSFPVYSIDSTSTFYASVVHASIPYSFYNINSSNNCLCYTNNSSTIYRVYINPGNYTATTLLSQLQSILPSSFTVTYSNTQNTFTFTNANTFTFIYNSLIGFSTCLALLGFTLTSQTSTVSGTTYTLTSNTLVNLASVRCICVNTSIHTGSIFTYSPNNQNILCSIPVSTAPFSIITFDNPNHYKVDLSTNIFNSIVIKLTDQAGNILNLNGLNWSITLQLDVIDYAFE
jgi:hypothetical protein